MLINAGSHGWCPGTCRVATHPKLPAYMRHSRKTNVSKRANRMPALTNVMVYADDVLLTRIMRKEKRKRCCLPDQTSV